MNLTLKYFFSIIILAAGFNFPQSHYLNRYNGIPVIAHPNRSAEAIAASSLRMQRMKELGVFGFYAVDLTPATYNSFISNDLKVFPYQLGWYSGVTKNEVVKYTDAVYSIWEAEGKGNGELGDAQIDFNTDVMQLSPDGNSVVTKSTVQPGNVLIYGPYYYQNIHYKQFPTIPPIIYTANFMMKIDLTGTPPPGYEETEVCTLKITAYNKSLASETDIVSPMVLKIKDFKSSPGGPIWNNWKEHVIANYNLAALTNLTQEELYLPQRPASSSYTSEYMQYKVIWNGPSYIKLSIDKINISDIRGRDLFTNTAIRNAIKTCVSEYTDTNYVLGWFGLNEPNSIDNYLPFREMNNLVHEENQKLDVFTTFTAGWLGRYGENFDLGVNNVSIYPGYEFYKRSGLSYVSINLYNYDYPYVNYPTIKNFPIESDYLQRNITYVTDWNLGKFIDKNVPISYSTQSGRFYRWKDEGAGCVNYFDNSILPSNSQMHYHLNLGLLYGAKEITVDPLFSFDNFDGDCIGSQYPNREGLIDFTTNSFTQLGTYFKDVISPRLAGIFGQTLKILNSDSQYSNIDAIAHPTINQRFIEKIEAIPNTGICFVDLGFFTDPSDISNNHFMVVNRFYNSLTNLKFTFKNLTIYKNWVVTDFIKNIKSTILATSNSAVYNDNIPLGDAGLYSVLPVVKYGGNLNYNETISTSTTLNGALTIEAGVTLTVNSTFYVHGDITLKNNAKILTTGNGYIFMNQGKKIIVSSNAYAEIKGTPTNKLTIDFSSPSYDRGIFTNSSSNLVLADCIIKDAYYGVKINNANYTIENSEFDGCKYGIYAYQTNGYTSTKILNNNIHHSLSYGIYLYQASPEIRGNSITNGAYGLYCSTTASPKLGKLDEGGNNLINANSMLGVYAYNGSNPFLGREACNINGGYNSIYGNTSYEIGASLNCVIEAEKNWWGNYPPNMGEVYTSSSTIDIIPALQSNPWSSGSFQIIATEEDAFDHCLSKIIIV